MLLKPYNWLELVGYDKILNRISALYHDSKLPDLILFQGYPGQGKPKFLLKAVAMFFCETKNACGSCSSCQQILNLNHPEIYFCDPESDAIRLDHAQKIAEHLRYQGSSVDGQQCFRVALVIDADRLNAAAANSLLKLMEELPENCLLWMTTSRSEAVLRTIRSRALSFRLPKIDESLMKTVLERELKESGVQSQELDLSKILQNCDSNISLAMDTIRMFSNSKDENIEDQLVLLWDDGLSLSERRLRAEAIAKNTSFSTREWVWILERVLNRYYRSIMNAGEQRKEESCGAISSAGLRARREVLRTLHLLARRPGFALNVQLALESLIVKDRVGSV